MHKYLLLALCAISWTLGQGQSTVSLSGQINNFQSEGTIYISNGHLTTPLEIDENGAFNTELQFGALPGFFTLNSISKKGKINREIPRIWIEDESVEVTIDWNERSVTSSSSTSYQELSDRIEALHGQKQIDLVLATPNEVPSMFWADRLKEEMAIQDLITYLKDTKPENQNSVYIKRMIGYSKAKQLKPVKKGESLEDFSLPNPEGEDVSILEGDKTKVVALFSSGCGYSVASVDLLEQLSTKADDQLEIITIWEDSNKEVWLNSHPEQKAKITWTNLWDETEFASTYLDRKMWPSFYVINEEGVLVDKFTGYSQKTAKKLGELVE